MYNISILTPDLQKTIWEATFENINEVFVFNNNIYCFERDNSGYCTYSKVDETTGKTENAGSLTEPMYLLNNTTFIYKNSLFIVENYQYN